MQKKRTKNRMARMIFTKEKMEQNKQMSNSIDINRQIKSRIEHTLKELMQNNKLIANRNRSDGRRQNNFIRKLKAFRNSKWQIIIRHRKHIRTHTHTKQ